MTRQPPTPVELAATERAKLASLSDVAKWHLRELAAAPYWWPETAGEWAIARALERRRWLGSNPNRGERPYELTDLGRAAANALALDEQDRRS